MSDAHRKVSAGHLSRDAYLYVRQSTVRQVVENTESTRRQYALRERAVALGWPTERVVVIDTDLGQSGADRDREGFQHLVAEVGMGRAGIVLGLEVSRLARNSTDWHRLLEICALSDTLILDEDGVYSPGDFNDRLLLGLKGTMSEAELHMLHARLRGGLLNQARRGGHAPGPARGNCTGSRWNTRASCRCCIIPATRGLTRSAAAGSGGFPAVAWRAGACRSRSGPCCCAMRTPGYIGWERFEANQRRLRNNALAYGADRRRSPPREGPALLQGLALCGVCGQSMTIRYHIRRGRQVPDYVCQREGIQTASAKCQSIPGAGIDRAVGTLLVELMTPVTLTVALKVQDELVARAEQVDAWRAQAVQRARQEADLARRRFMQTHPDNRLVADVLEAEWNARLRALDHAQQELEQQRAQDPGQPDDAQRQRILALSTDFPRLWNDPATPDRERKRMAHLLIEDVTLTRGTDIALGIRLRGGATRQLQLPPELPAWQLYRTSEHVVAEIDRLTENHTDAQIAAILNGRGLRTGHGIAFRPQRIQVLRRTYGLKTRYQRLRAQGLLSLTEIAARLQVSTSTIKTWRHHGLLRAHPYNDRNQCLYEPPIGHPPSKQQGRKLANRKPIPTTPVSACQQGAV